MITVKTKLLTKKLVTNILKINNLKNNKYHDNKSMIINKQTLNVPVAASHST